MRKLQTTDIFSACRIVTAIGIKDELKTICMKANNIKEIATEEVGFDLVYTLFEKAVQQKAEARLYEFFSGIFEVSVEEIKAMDPCDFIHKALECADIDKWKAFFSQVAALMKLK